MTIETERREADPYDEDFLLWAEQQAELLRRRAAEHPEAFEGLDIENLVDEIGDLARGAVRRAKTSLIHFFHRLVAFVAEPGEERRDRLIEEGPGSLAEFESEWLPSMRQRIDLEELWQSAVEIARSTHELLKKPMRAELPDRCPFTFDELLSDDFDLAEAVARLGGSLAVPERPKAP